MLQDDGVKGKKKVLVAVPWEKKQDLRGADNAECIGVESIRRTSGGECSPQQAAGKREGQSSVQRQDR
jgi:hypothetical protein